jgi:thymidylate synthase (FAD)
MDQQEKMTEQTVNVVAPNWEFITPPQVIDTWRALTERCGRVCHKSEAKLGKDTDGFIRMLIGMEHLSVLEHAAITIRIICDRSCSHQLVRHRIAAYSQESQRFCDYSSLGFQAVCPPSISKTARGLWRKISGHWRQFESNVVPGNLLTQWLDCVSGAYQTYNYLRGCGVPPEDARSVLPNATKTELAVTFNLRMWRHVFTERALNPRAQWQIRYLMQNILSAFALRLPAVFGDLAARIGSDKTIISPRPTPLEDKGE